MTVLVALLSAVPAGATEPKGCNALPRKMSIQAGNRSVFELDGPSGQSNSWWTQWIVFERNTGVLRWKGETAEGMEQAEFQISRCEPKKAASIEGNAIYLVARAWSYVGPRRKCSHTQGESKKRDAEYGFPLNSVEVAYTGDTPSIQQVFAHFDVQGDCFPRMVSLYLVPASPVGGLRIEVKDVKQQGL
jgi:hypothetical protein